jgi:hypothetical protein
MLKKLDKLLQDQHLTADKHKALVDALMVTIEKRESNESIDVKPISGMLGKALKGSYHK